MERSVNVIMKSNYLGESMLRTMRWSRFTILTFLLISSILTVPAGADTPGEPPEKDGGLTIVEIENGWIHLGDQFEEWMYHPFPDGIEWETTFTLEPFNATSATISFTAASITIADLHINGISIAIPTNHYPIDPIARQLYRRNLITLPAAAIRAGENTIGFQSLFTDEYDDFEFGNVFLYLQ